MELIESLTQFDRFIEVQQSYSQLQFSFKLEGKKK